MSEEKPIKIAKVPDGSNLIGYVTLEEEIEKLEYLLKEETEAHAAGVSSREKRLRKMKDRIISAIQCLTSGNSVFVSDPRPALKYLREALDE